MGSVSTSSFSIGQLLRAIKRLPSDAVTEYPGKGYTTQKEHWIGWLSEYQGTGAYGREPSVSRSAEYAYNHIVEWRMLTWLAGAAGVPRSKVLRARRAAEGSTSMQAGAAAVRKLIPWTEIEVLLRTALPR